MKKYDAIVIGSGGGTKIATPAFNLGYKVAIIEEWKLGGTCLNRGCIPSKMLIHPANVALAIKEAKKFDIHVKGKISVDTNRLVKRVSDTVDAESAGIGKSYKSIKNFDYYHHHAHFVSNKVLEVNGKKITADKIFIANGARPQIPDIEGLDKVPYMTSTEALRNRKLPKKLLVIGGGYIACELGHAYSAFGSEVHFIVRKERFLMREDKQVSEEFTKVFKKYHTAHIGFAPVKVSYKNKKIIVTVKNKKNKTKNIVGDALLMATGVVPNLQAAP